MIGNAKKEWWITLLVQQVTDAARRQRVEQTGLSNRSECSVLELWLLVSCRGKGHSWRLRCPLSGCIHGTLVRWRDRQHASGASPATWLNLSLRVSLGSVKTMREQGQWYWVMTHWTVPTSSVMMGRKWGKRCMLSCMYVILCIHTHFATYICSHFRSRPQMDDFFIFIFSFNQNLHTYISL